jgi:HAD superfamily hydrolase (TIGR01509 family)
MKYQLVIFDMDGTLTEEVYDFAAIRRDIGVPENVGILECIAGLKGEAATRAQEILHGHEIAGADACCVKEGAAEILRHLREAGVKTALLTRNSAVCTQRILGRHGLELEHVRTREDLPHKPHPEAILSITARFGVPREQTLMVGDYLYDLQTAQAAGCDAALIVPPDEALPDFAGMATYVVRRLMELVNVVKGEA